MIGYDNILDAIKSRIAEADSGALVYIGLCPQNFERPSYYVRIFDVKNSWGLGGISKTKMTVLVSAFTAADMDNQYPAGDTMAAGEAMTDMSLCGGLAVGETFIDITRIKTSFGDGVAEARFKLEYQDETEPAPDASPFMREVSIEVTDGR